MPQPMPLRMPLPPAAMPLLPDRVAFVAVSGLDFAPALAEGLAAQGARVALIDDAAADRFRSRAAVAAAFAEAAARTGPPDLVVHAAAAAEALVPAPLVSLDLDAFNHMVDARLRATLYTLQSAAALMTGRGGAIAVLGPALSLVGAGGLTALSTCAEGQRALVKSAARQWGSRGLRLNWLGLADSRYAAQLAGKGPEVPELGPPPPPLGRLPDPADDLAPLLAFLASPAGRSLTGATLAVDGGNWMTP